MLKDNWLKEAACSDPKYHTDLFFSGDNRRMSPKKADRALSICRRCTVVEECARDLVEVGHWRDVYPHQIRAGRRLWVKEEVATLPRRESTVL
jgi:hypothetical protein